MCLKGFGKHKYIFRDRQEIVTIICFNNLNLVLKCFGVL